MHALYEQIYAAVKQIPRGKVATYAQVAAMVGNPHLCRVVGNALHVNPYFGDVSCHRVVNAEGRLAGKFAFGGVETQADILRAEGIEVVDDHVDLSVYRM